MKAKDPKQMVVFQGTNIFYCNNEIVEAIKKHCLDTNQFKGLKGCLAEYSGMKLIKVSIKKMRELIKQSKEYQVPPKSPREILKMYYGSV